MTIADFCGNTDRLIDYVYDECDAGARERLEAHLAVCRACALEAESLRGVRRELATWTPPDCELGFRIVQNPTEARRTAWWSAVPAWAMAAAAVLVLSAAAAVANLEIRYGAGGLVVRTGWGAAREPADAVQASRPSVQPAAETSAPWRTELATLERQLREEFKGIGPQRLASAAVPAPAPVVSSSQSGGLSEADVLRLVRGLIEDSERRQQRELAYRVAQLTRDVDAQRQADLVRIEQGLGQLEGMTGAEVARQRELLNYLVRVSQTRR